MKPPKGPFWAWNDIGEGPQWYICRIEEGDEGKPMINYLTGDFEDFWYDDDWDKSEIKLIRSPAALDA